MVKMKKLHSLLLLIVLWSCGSKEYDLIIENATVYDGTGKPGITADVAVQADTIAAIGDLSRATAPIVIDAKGLALTPGFIDSHSHHDRGLLEEREALAVVSQGVTTIIVGQDGFSDSPVSQFFQQLNEKPVAVNVASYSGHNTLRELVMGENYKRAATQEEIDSMSLMLKQDMEAGALGFSTGLEYDPGIYSTKEEVLHLSKLLPSYQGRYISHLRSEDRYFWTALQEIIQIGRETKVPVQVSHIKLAMRSLWNKADSTIALLNQARTEGVDITADIYPYTYWSSTIRVLFPDRNFTDEKEAAFILKETTSAEGIIFSNYDPDPSYNGKSLKEVADAVGTSPEKMLIEAIRRLDECEKEKGDCSGSIVATSMAEEDVATLMQWQHTSICSDGASSGRHPRGFGAFPRVLSFYVKQGSLSMEEAIYKMTGLAATNLGLKKRGRIDVGHYADLVLFDPATVKDNATVQNPQAISSGIKNVWVNGQLVFDKGKVTHQYPGRVIKRN